MLKRLIKNTGIYITTGFLNQAFTSLAWIVLAWWLAPAQIALYFLAMFVIEFFTTLSMFSLNAAVGRFYYQRKEENKSFIFSNGLFAFLGFLIFFLLVFLLTSRLIPLFIPELADILKENLILFLAIIAVNSLTNFFLIHYIASKDAPSYGKLQIVKTAIFCFLALGLVKLGLGIVGLFYAFLFSSLFIVIYFLTKEKNLIDFQAVSSQTIKALLAFAFPLLLLNVIGVIAGYFGRLLLNKYAGLTTLGVYSFFLMMAMQVNGLWSSFNSAWTPEVLSKFLESEKKATENAKIMAFFSSFFYLSIFALFIILGELGLFKLFLKEIYLSSIHIFYILLLYPLFLGLHTAFRPSYLYTNKMKRYLFVSLLISGIILVSTPFMVKFFNEIGAALTYLGSSILTVLLYMFAFRKKVEIPRKVIVWTLFVSGLTFLNIVILLKTPFRFLFPVLTIVGAFLAYKIGELDKKKYILFNFLKQSLFRNYGK